MVTTKNSRYLPRFQELCQQHRFKPTWLTNYEMAECPIFREFGRDILERDAGEIGMHLHAWNSPPIARITRDDIACGPYLIEYPEKVLREKVRFITELLEERFERKMVSHRAGRWALNSVYARALVDFGYRVDCSVTPHCSWHEHPGDPNGSGGTDYRGFPTSLYFMDCDRIDRPGDSDLLELPVSIVHRNRLLARRSDRLPRLARRVANRFFPPVIWLRPNGRNLRGMLGLLAQAKAEGWPFVEFTLHSSELMPGGSPWFRKRKHIERIYRHLQILFANAAESFAGATLSEFHEAFVRSRADQVRPRSAA
jgi:hypothetical protein